MRVRLLYAVFFASGVCGLVYESIWSHYLKLILGHAAYAQAVVLVVFVGGMALGAWLASRFTERIGNPILWYAAVEALVAAVAFSFHLLFVAASDWALGTLLPAACPGEGACWASWLLAAALILPGAVLLGTTFPLMSAGVLRLGTRTGRGLSALYFFNSAGAALGVLATGFWLIPAVGLPGTLLVAGVANVAVAVAAWLTMSARPGPLPGAMRASAAEGDAVSAANRWLLVAACCTGLSSFIYEVVWVRMLSQVLGAATQSFELMLASFILGLALGGAWVRGRIDSLQQPERMLAYVQLAMGVLAMATLPLYIASFDAMAFTMNTVVRNDQGFILFTVVSGVLAMGVMLPAAFCAGMTLPLATASLLARGHGERGIGQVYGINTLGAIIGVLLTVYLLMPQFGVKWALAAGALIDVGLGGFLLWRFPSMRPGRRLARPGLFAAALALAVTLAIPAFVSLDTRRMVSGVFRLGRADLDAASQVVFHRDGRTATISVVDTDGFRSLRTNGKSDGATDPRQLVVSMDDHTVTLLGALGPAHHPNARRGAVVGFGTGVTTSVLLAAGRLESVETIEIEPLVLEAAPLFLPKNAAALSDPRSRIVIDDARAHFARAPQRYDLIVSEPSNPWVSGVSGLFTQEFYAHAARRLAPEGHFVQWFHLYESSPALAASVLRAFVSVFEDFRVYAPNNGDLILVGRADGGKVALSPDAFQLPGMAAALAPLGIDSVRTLAAHEIARPGPLKLLFDSVGSPPNSDFFPYVDNRGAHDRFVGANAQVFISLSSAPVPLQDFAAKTTPEWLGRIQEANRHMPWRIHELASAWQGRRLLRGEPVSERHLAYIGGYRKDYLLTRDWLWDCRTGPETQDLWDSALIVAQEINNGLAPEDAAALWRGVLSGPCRTKLPPDQIAWLELFAAVGARDVPKVEAAAAQLVQRGAGKSPAQREYLLLASVAGPLARSDTEAMRKIFEEQLTGIPPGRLELPWFRYLVTLLRVKRQSGAVPAS